ncbi:MAG TPA: DUF3467 domain-containing protein [bacterium]|nr:DUF3467 domain-containing protein [bacterium]
MDLPSPDAAEASSPLKVPRAPVSYVASSAEPESDENNADPEEAGRLSLRIDPEIAAGQYANYLQVRFNSIEMVLDFSRVIPDLNSIQLVSRVLINPALGRTLYEALRTNVEAYERRYGRCPAYEKEIDGPAERSIGFRTAEDLAREGLLVGPRRSLQLPSDPSKPDPQVPPSDRWSA